MGDDLESFVGTVTVRSASSGDVVKTLQSPNHIASKCRVCPQGRLCSVLACRAIVVWESDGSSEPVARVTNGNRKSFTDLAFHPSGRYLAATSNDTTVKLYDTESWQVAKTFTWNVGRLRSIAFSPDGTLAAVGSDSGKIVVWDVDL